MATVPSVDKHQALAGHFLFRHLRPEEMTALLSRARVERKKTNGVIFRQDSPGYGLMAVLSGRVKICSRASNGREIVLNIINPGEVFGEVALLDGKARTADAIALSACELLIIDRRDFIPFLQAHPDVTIRLLGVLCERLRRTSEQVQDLLFLDVPSRLAKTLLRLAETHGQTTPAGRRIDLKFSQRELGSLVGLTRESINKQLRGWQKRGLIRVDEGAITIRDAAALEGEGEAEEL
jgi:CRP-like cAMP-binding protein